jgi:hypothetical protein
MRTLKIEYIFLLFSFVTLTKGNLLAQSDSLTAKNTIFVEVLGNGGLYSINFDRILAQKKNIKVTARIGASFVPNTESNGKWSLPVEFNFLCGKKNHWEFGIGFGYGHGLNNVITNYYNENLLISSTLFGTIKILNYRCQKPEGGIFFQIGFVSIIQIHEFNESLISGYRYKPIQNYFYPNLGLGYTFKSKKK